MTNDLLLLRAGDYLLLRGTDRLILRRGKTTGAAAVFTPHTAGGVWPGEESVEVFAPHAVGEVVAGQEV